MACVSEGLALHPRIALNLFRGADRLCVLSPSSLGDLQTCDTTPKDSSFSDAFKSENKMRS